MRAKHAFSTCNVERWLIWLVCVGLYLDQQCHEVDSGPPCKIRLVTKPCDAKFQLLVRQTVEIRLRKRLLDASPMVPPKSRVTRATNMYWMLQQETNTRFNFRHPELYRLIQFFGKPGHKYPNIRIE